MVECYEDPDEGYAVDSKIQDDREISGYRYENIIVTPDQFEVAEPYEPDGEDP